MPATLVLGLALTVAASLALNAGYLLQHVGGATAPAVDVRRPLSTARGLLSSRVWALGTGASLFGSVLHIGALGFAPITLVQAFSAAGLAVVVPVAARVARSTLGRGEPVAVAAIVAALAVLAMSPDASSLDHVPAGPAVAFGAVVVAAAAALVAVRGSRRPAALAGAAGLLYGIADGATKAFTAAVGHGLLGAVLSPWPPVIVAVCAAAFFAFQRGLQIGSAATVIVVMTAATNVTAVLAGIVVFGESLGAGTGVACLHALAMVVIGGASWWLAAAQARIAAPRQERHRASTNMTPVSAG
jgi:hypothetical protein